MRWLPVFNLWLCALLSLQQPSVLVRTGAWIQAQSRMDAQDPPVTQILEEEKLTGLRTSGPARLKARVVKPWRQAPEAVRFASARVAVFPLPVVSDFAWQHWRAALLPPRVPLSDEHPRARS
ncbi:MAG: hypothetical protein ABW123_17135 [Cystobacter sp.]